MEIVFGNAIVSELVRDGDMCPTETLFTLFGTLDIKDGPVFCCLITDDNGVFLALVTLAISDEGDMAEVISVVDGEDVGERYTMMGSSIT